MPTRYGHKRHTLPFRKLIWADQSRAINVAVLNLDHLIRAHVDEAGRHGRTRKEVRTKCMKLVAEMSRRVSRLPV
jgi:hypothetical protein